MRVNSFLGALALCGLPMLGAAQSPLSGFMNGKGQSVVAVSYSAEKYDNVLLKPNEADGVPVFNEVSVNSVSLYASYGLSDRFDVVVGLPYISTKGQADEAVLNELGFENTRSGLQDVSAYVKFQAVETMLGAGNLRVMAAAGLRAPLGDYRVDEGLQSILAIGNRATQLNGFALAQYQLPGGLFAAGQLGYSLRNGDVPNALLSELKVGYAARSFYVDAWYATQLSDGGVDILGEGFVGNFPATDVSFTRFGLNVYVPITGGLGVSGGVNSYLTGRNVGQATGFSGSVVYNF